MVFCYQNCSDLLWEKIVQVIEKKLWKFKAESQEFAIILRLPEQFVRKQWKVRIIFGHRMLFNLFPKFFNCPLPFLFKSLMIKLSELTVRRPDWVSKSEKSEKVSNPDSSNLFFFIDSIGIPNWIFIYFKVVFLKHPYV